MEIFWSTLKLGVSWRKQWWTSQELPPLGAEAEEIQSLLGLLLSSVLVWSPCFPPPVTWACGSVGCRFCLLLGSGGGGTGPCPRLQQGVGCGCPCRARAAPCIGAAPWGWDGENNTLCLAWACSFPEDRAALLGQRNVKILKAFKLCYFYLGAFCGALQSSQPSV